MLPSPTATQIPSQPAPDVVAWLKGKTIADLAAIEVFPPCAACNGTATANGAPCPLCDATGKARVPRNFIPDVLRWRGGDGLIHEEAITFAIPDEDDHMRSTADAVKHVAQLHPGKTITTPDQAREYVGAARFENLESAALVALAVRSAAPPFGRKYLLSILIKTHTPATIREAFLRLDLLYKLFEVPVSTLTEAQFWGGVAEIARVRNVGFFAVLDPALQAPFIARLAVELQACRIERSSSGSPTASTPE